MRARHLAPRTSTPLWAAVPAVLVVLVVAGAAVAGGVSPVDVARFGAYVALGLVLPGFVLWRLLVAERGSSLLADAVFGTPLAYAVELFVYLAATHLGAPEWARWWPVVPLGISAVPRLRPLVWRRGARQPRWWTWSLSGLVLLAIAVLAQVAWAIAPISGPGVRSLYVDMPYHLSLVSALSRHVPTGLPFVEGEPLYYHWFDHAHLAAARHATGIEPLVLISRLDMLPGVIVVLLGVALLARRVSGSHVAGLVSAGLLTLGTSAVLWPYFGQLYLSAAVYVSPTTAFASVMLMGDVAVALTLLGREVRPRRSAWAAAVVLLAATSGAKGPAVPVLLAGYVAVLVMSLLLRQRPGWRAPVLALLCLVTLGVAEVVIYGRSAQGTTLRPLGIADSVSRTFGLRATDDGGSWWVAVLLAMLYVALRVSCLVAALGLFTRLTSRDPRAHFLVGGALGGLVATLSFSSGALNQVYFLLVTPVFVVVSAGWGVAALLARAEGRTGLRVLGAGLVAGVVTSTILFALPLRHFRSPQATLSLLELATQLLIVLAVLALTALGLLLLARHRPPFRRAAPLACVGLVLGLGLTYGPRSALGLTIVDGHQHRYVTMPVPSIGVGGLEAATWLREHSGSEDVVATNSHCLLPGVRCDHRTFWMAAFVERQMLVEGWAYTAISADRAARSGEDVRYIDFWKPRLLTDNDQAFADPTPQSLAVLHDTYKVSWLLVDERYPVDLGRLEQVATLAYQAGQYAVLKIG